MKIRHFLILPFVAAVTLLASCSKDGDEYILTPPTGFVKAEPGIIGVDSKGNLTLDGWKADNPAYIVYFKYGSLIAMKGNTEWDAWNNGIIDIAWVPKEYRSKLGNITDYASVPYAASDVFPTDSPVAGLGDPCHFAKKDGVAGGYRMPTGDPYEQFTDGGWDASGGTFGQPGRKSTQGQFYPAAGYRDISTGMLSDVGMTGYYWPASTRGAHGFA